MTGQGQPNNRCRHLHRKGGGMGNGENAMIETGFSSPRWNDRAAERGHGEGV